MIIAGAASAHDIEGQSPDKTVQSQGLEEGKKFRLWLPWLGFCRLYPGVAPESLHGVSLHLKVGGDVAAGCVDTGVAEVVTDHRNVRSGLQEGRRTAMSAMSLAT